MDDDCKDQNCQDHINVTAEWYLCRSAPFEAEGNSLPATYVAGEWELAGMSASLAGTHTKLFAISVATDDWVNLIPLSESVGDSMEHLRRATFAYFGSSTNVSS